MAGIDPDRRPERAASPPLLATQDCAQWRGKRESGSGNGDAAAPAVLCERSICLQATVPGSSDVVPVLPSSLQHADQLVVRRRLP